LYFKTSVAPGAVILISGISLILTSPGTNELPLYFKTLGVAIPAVFTSFKSFIPIVLFIHLELPES
jgi:hypothetical protein